MQRQITARLDDQRALQGVYVQSYPVVRGYVLKNNGSEAEAKDLFQEAMVTAWANERKGTFEAKDEKAIGAYVFTIAKRKWLDKLRSKTYRSTLRIVKEEVEDTLVEDSPADTDELDYLQQLYQQLDEKCQVMLKKFYFQKMSMREIADDLSVGEESVRTMKYRCVMKLRKMHLALQEKNK